MNNIKMLYYDRIDFSEGINVNNTSKSKEHLRYLPLFVFLK